MVINYKKTQKTILRVSPRVPLSEHLPAICEKCEFDVESTVLLKDVHSLAPLDLSCSLNDYAIREVYARDPSSMYQTSQNILKRWVLPLFFFCTDLTIVGSAGQPSTPLSPASPIHAGISAKFIAHINRAPFWFDVIFQWRLVFIRKSLAGER